MSYPVERWYFLYSGTHQRSNGKLRLPYKCNPLAFVVEKAGGEAISETQRIVDIEPGHLHSLTPVHIGNRRMIKELMQMLPNTASALPYIIGRIYRNSVMDFLI